MIKFMKVLQLLGLGLVAVFFSYIVYGQTAPVAPAPTFLDSALKFIQSAGGMTGALIVGIEMLFRMIPTAKPLSVLIPVSYTFNGLAAIFEFLGKFSNTCVGVFNNTSAPGGPPAPGQGQGG